ncbi:hypothetical protein ACEUZ9_004112 [Paracoccus litorisediminis]|uniref:hypothetical protein n=1 Tax=Paracoccus litorisediminis TaxID=2006130 RepID=UPI0037304C0D
MPMVRRPGRNPGPFAKTPSLAGTNLAKFIEGRRQFAFPSHRKPSRKDFNMTLSKDALIFGLGFLRFPKSKLSFGGEGAKMEITERARAALDELLASGYAVSADADTSIPGREYYRGTTQEPSLGHLAQEAGLNPFDPGKDWEAFRKKQPDPENRPAP